MAEHQKYRITDRIDAGGMAEVFRGVAESLQGFKKNIAIKRILPTLCKNKKFISMFLDEARLSLHLQHANVVGVFDIGVSPADGGDSAYFIVMEFVDGLHLKGLIESFRRQNRRLSVAQALYIMMEVCKGLAYAHDVNDPESGRPLHIVHRDVSPPNILMSKMGEVKLVDFGLAKANSQLESTDPGVVKGKFSYLSPEAASGKEVDRRADIFAVGILLYELLTGRRLFYGENDYQTVELVRQARVPSITQQNPEVEPELEAVVRKALARDLEQRFQTSGELQDAIAQYLFSRGLKVTSRDIATLVRECVAEKQKAQPQPRSPKSLIDALIQEELVKFTSLEEINSDGRAGARPLSPEDLNGARPLDSSSFVDTRNWTNDVGEATLVDGDQPMGANGVNGHAMAVPTPARVATPLPPKRRTEVASLEEMLEGDRAVPERDARPRAASPVKRGGRGIWIAVVALLLIGGSAVIYLVKVGVLGR
jgi:eukaryotic-like serine/threonine-protein kinase